MAESNPPQPYPTKSSPCIKLEKNAGLIMATNNSSIVSKRSVERLYHPKPHFFQYFVRKPQRRSPAINRGYWLRMQAVGRVVKEFLQRPTQKQKVVINLGCGFDPLPFQWLAREPELCQNVRFVDVDYPELMITKTTILKETTALKELVKPKAAAGPGFVTEAEQYYGIGCDLGDVRGLDAAFKCLRNLEKALVLCVAEVSVTYMHPDAADALIVWARALSDDVTFCLLEQFLPDGQDHPFAKTMLRHFEKLHTPLRSIHKYPGSYSQSQRFHDAGWETVQFVNLWELWSDPNFLAPSQRSWLDGVEPFDEWEEFALFAAHYFLLTARTKPALGERPAPSEEDARSKTSTETACDLAPARKSCGLEFVGNPKSQGLRRYGALLRLQDEPGYKQTAIAHHGGMTHGGRTSTWDVYSPSSELGDGAPRVPPVRITARQGHTITRLENGRSILVGGRTSPAVGMQDCYIQTESGWLPIQDLPVPRYRHSAAAVLLPNLVPGLLIVGGKCAADRVEDEIILWDQAVGWRSLRVFRGSPQPRFGATLVALGDDFGLLSGGMQADGVVLQDLWRWKIIYRDDRAVGIHFTPCALKIDTGAGLYLGRFGASHCLRKDQLLLIGGIALSGCVESFSEVLSLDLSSLSHTDEKNEGSLQFSGIDLRRDSSVPRPMLVGHATLNSADDETLIVGGGAVCFSFGTYWNTGIYILHGSNAAACLSWALVDSSTEAAPAEKVSLGLNGLQAARLNQPGSVERVTLGGAVEFPDLVRQSKPMILERLYFGQCRSLWSKDYLRSKIGAERPVVVHEAQGRTMNFQQKDFAYMKKPFGIFLDEIHNGGHQYLRSISSSDPSKRAADLDLDFPEIARDFSIPLELRFVAERHHSSPLRISGDVAMWLHVDTMANVLFQIEGSKRLVLFPPADMVNLDFAPGSTTSSVEIFRDGDPREIRSVPKTHPVEATLRPGEVIFIPPLWAHTAAPLQKVSTAVNVFFRNLSKGYAAGRDVYGNRDLEAYEHGRRDITKIARAFDGIPPDLAHAYLLRLAGELRSKAERYAPVSD